MHTLSSGKGMNASASVDGRGEGGGFIPMMQARIGHSSLPEVEFRLLLHSQEWRMRWGGLHIRSPLASYNQQLSANISSEN